MSYLIDTDWVIDHLADVPQALELLDRLSEEGLAISIVTYMEVMQGVERSPDPRAAQTKLDALLEAVPVLPFSPAVARRCARLRETLLRRPADPGGI